MSAGEGHTCAVNIAGVVIAFGWNVFGQCNLPANVVVDMNAQQALEQQAVARSKALGETFPTAQSTCFES